MFIRACIIFAIIAGLITAALYSDTKAAPVDNRPAANTIACRDAQIFKLRTMLVHVEHNPLSPSGYNEANETIADLLFKAEQLQSLCK